MTISRFCNACGYSYQWTPKARGKCPDCERAYQREKSRRRKSQYATRVRDSVSWQHARALARRRDGGCVLRDQGGCEGRLEVHHRIPLNRGGDNSLANLLTVCSTHHGQLEREARSFSSARSHPPPGFRETHSKVIEGPSVG
jgi:5-methylcytosine-specific restriction endonuclease McrA